MDFMRSSLVLLLFVANSAVADQTPESRAAAFAAYERKDFATCAEISRRLADNGPAAERVSNLANAASCFALAGNADAAFRSLDDLLAAGYVNTKQLREDPDFASLRKDERWAPLYARAEANWEKKFGADNRELWKLREADEEDRRPGADPVAGVARDRQRLARVKEIVAAGGLKTANDYFIAAMLHQHGAEPSDFVDARKLAMKAAELDSTNTRAKWLAAAAEDRYLWSIGKPQRYGTQFHQVDGVWTIDPIDPSVTDSERAEWNVPPLAQAKKRAEGMNAKKP